VKWRSKLPFAGYSVVRSALGVERRSLYKRLLGTTLLRAENRRFSGRVDDR
jgi:hypothetical protein